MRLSLAIRRHDREHLVHIHAGPLEPEAEGAHGHHGEEETPPVGFVGPVAGAFVDEEVGVEAPADPDPDENDRAEN